MSRKFGDSIEFLFPGGKSSGTFLGFDLQRDIRIATAAIVLTSNGVSYINPMTIVDDYDAAVTPNFAGGSND